MAQSIRLFYKKVQGATRGNFNWPVINKHSAVIITAAEMTSAGQFDESFKGAPEAELANFRPELGLAPVWVSNVGAHGDANEAGGVEFMIHADWGSPIDVAVTITVLEDIQQYVGVT